MTRVKKAARHSKSLLKMKFMQRTKNRLKAEKEAEEGKAMYSKDITKEMLNAVDKFIVEPSYVVIHNLIVGRLSYGGFNPEVEKFMTKPDTTPVETGEMEKEISDNEMVEFSNSVGRTMANKFNKNKRKKTSGHFLKPVD